MVRYDKETVKAAASGYWHDVLNQVAGIDDEFLVTRERSCPKCGGNTRWRCFGDYRETGGAICSHCGLGHRGSGMIDGFQVVMWSNGVGFPESLKLVAEFLGVKGIQGGNSPSKTKPRRKRKAEDEIEFLPEFPHSFSVFCAKKGISQESIKAMGGRLARHRKRHTVIAFPVLDGSGALTGYSLYEASGGTLPLWNPTTQETTQLKMKTLEMK